jgi:hypothetical protein
MGDEGALLRGQGRSKRSPALRRRVWQPDDSACSPHDRLLIRLADELHDTVSISDPLWAELRAGLAEEAILQLIMMAGYYRTVAYAPMVCGCPLSQT